MRSSSVHIWLKVAPVNIVTSSELGSEQAKKGRHFLTVHVRETFPGQSPLTCLRVCAVAPSCWNQMFAIPRLANSGARKLFSICAKRADVTETVRLSFSKHYGPITPNCATPHCYTLAMKWSFMKHTGVSWRPVPKITHAERWRWALSDIKMIASSFRIFIMYCAHSSLLEVKFT